jgi:hypothetical protein
VEFVLGAVEEIIDVLPAVKLERSGGSRHNF